MNINSLPEDIIIAVLQCCLHSKAYVAKEWKSCLPVLSVCQMWRTLGMPYVFNRVGIEYDTKSLKQNNERNDAAITSNLGLIASAGKTGLIKHISISIFHVVDPFPGLYAVIDLLKPAKWPAVTSLYLKLEHSLQNGHIALNAALINDEIDNVCNEIHSLMPNITCLKYMGIRPNVNYLFGKLTKLYGKQITQFINKHELPDTQDLVLDRISEFKLSMFAEGILPKVSSENLVLLELAGIPYSYKWPMFAVSEKPQPIVFPNLLRLKVHYVMTTEDHVEYTKLTHPVVSFPMLQQLITYMDEALTPILDYAILPDNIQLLDISGSMNTLKSIKTLPEIDDIKLNLTYNKPEEVSDPFLLINSIACKASKSCSAVIFINRLVPNDIYNNARCSSLVRMSICTEVAGNCIPNILMNMPNLKYASFIKVTHVTSEDSEYVLNYGTYKRTDAEPLNTMLANLHLQFTKSDTFAAAVFTKYLLPRLPALESLSAKQLPSLTINKFVREYSEHYPRLSNIAMQLGK